MPVLTLAGRLIVPEAIWYHYVDQRSSPLSYCLVIDKQEVNQLACVTRYVDCALDHPLLEVSILGKDATRRSMGLLWELLQEWNRLGLVRKGSQTLITYTLQNITHVCWDYEQLTIRGGAAEAGAVEMRSLLIE